MSCPVATLTRWWRQTRASFPWRRLPPSAPVPPGPRWALLSDLAYILNPARAHVAGKQKYGDPFRLPSIAGPVVLTSEPSLMKQVFALRGDSFDLWAQDVLGTLVGPRALNMVTGEDHSRLKALVAPTLGREATRNLAAPMSRWLHQAVQRLPLDAPQSLHDVCQHLSRGVIVRALWGEDQGQRVERVEAHIKRAVDHLSPALVFLTPLRVEGAGLLPWGKFKKVRQALDQEILGEIRRRRTLQEPGPGLLGQLLAARDGQGNGLDDQEVLDQVLLLIFAGYQTTGAALSWALCHLATYPIVYQDLALQLEGLDPELDVEKVLEVPLLGAVIQETLRLHPMSPDISPRILKCPIVLGNYTVPAGTAVGVSIGLTHRDSRRWSQPDQFLPDRFLKETPAHHAWIPFGGGVRGCIGAAFALQQLKLAVATFVRRGAWQILGPLPARPARHNLVMGVDSALRITLHPPSERSL